MITAELCSLQNAGNVKDANVNAHAAGANLRDDFADAEARAWMRANCGRDYTARTTGRGHTVGTGYRSARRDPPAGRRLARHAERGMGRATGGTTWLICDSYVRNNLRYCSREG